MLQQLMLVIILYLNSPVVSQKVCEDKNQQCSSWAERGECSKNPAYMLPNCAKSCGECGSGLGLENVGEHCWHACNKIQGKCLWCGPNGYCCRKGWKSHGCDGKIGGNKFHACTGSGLENVGEHCWHGCNKIQGKCSWCGPNGYCCRKGWKSNDGCDGRVGGHNFHACVFRQNV